MIGSLCHTCGANAICEVVSMLHKKKIAATVQNCPYCCNVNNYNRRPKELPQEARRRSINEVLDVAQRIKSLNQNKHEEDIEVVECEVCHEETAIATCQRCGKQICGSCLIQEIGSNCTYCEDCYDNLSPAKL